MSRANKCFFCGQYAKSHELMLLENKVTKARRFFHRIPCREDIKQDWFLKAWRKVGFSLGEKIITVEDLK